MIYLVCIRNHVLIFKTISKNRFPSYFTDLIVQFYSPTHNFFPAGVLSVFHELREVCLASLITLHFFWDREAINKLTCVLPALASADLV